MKQAVAAVLGLTLCALAQGARADGAPPNYIGLMGSYVVTDDVRGTDNGVGWHLLYGSPMDERLSLELNFFGHRADQEVGGTHDNAIGGGIDLSYLYGSRRFGAFVLGGLGSIWEDFVGDEEISPYFNVGVGVLLGGESLQFRAEGRYYAILNSDTYANESALFDARLNAGLMYAFGAGEPASAVAPEPAPLPSTPVPVAAPADGDGDGVSDGSDQCPDTPPGTQVDANGCPLDEDEDGVLNAADACPRTPPGFAVDDSGCVRADQTVVVLDSVHFEFDSAKLTGDARARLDRVAEGLNAQPGMRVEIIGHTDALGSDAYNDKLSLARASSVREFLVYRGVGRDRIEVAGRGEQEPIADNETEEGRARNRRVEFHVLGQ